MIYETLENGILSTHETLPCPKCGYEATNSSSNPDAYVLLEINGQKNKKVQKEFSKINGKYCMGCFALFISQNVTKIA